MRISGRGLVLGLIAAMVGCAGTTEQTCTPHEATICVGPGGCAGTQVCNTEGSAYGACSCTAGADGGVDAVGDTAPPADAAGDTVTTPDGAPPDATPSDTAQPDAAQRDGGTDAAVATVVTDIRALQQDPSFTGALIPVGTLVRVEGAVVTAASSTASVFFIQNPSGPKEYSGIIVKKTSAITTAPAVGDVVTALVATLVEESRSCNADAGACPTRHSLINASLYTATTGGTSPTPLAVTGADLLASTAKYDGVLIQLSDSSLTVATGGTATLTPLSNGVAAYGQYYAPPAVVPAGTVVATCAGVVDLYNRQWETYARTAADLVFVGWPGDAGVQTDASTATDASAGQADRVTMWDGALTDAQVASCPGLLITEVQTEGSAGASDELIEIAGPPGMALGGYKLIYRSATGTTDVTVKSFTSETIPAATGRLVLANVVWSGGTPDVTITQGLAATGGGLALETTSGTVIDSVGWGTATNAFVEGTAAPAARTPSSLQRDACIDTNSNAADFFVAAPSPWR